MAYQIVAQRSLLRIGGVIAAGAGLVGAPADFGAGRGLGGVVQQIVAQGSLLRIGGVVAAGAGHVGIPAGFGAAGGLCGVAYQIVAQGSLLNISGVIAAGTAHVGAPAGFGAGRGLRGMAHQVMGVRVGFAVVAPAHLAVGPGGAGGGPGFRVGRIQLVGHMVFTDPIMLLAVAAVPPPASPTVGGRVGRAVVAPAHLAVGRHGAGGGDGLRVVFGVRADGRIAALADQIYRVLGIGDFLIRGRGRAYVLVGVGVAVVAPANPAVGRSGAGGGGGFRVVGIVLVAGIVFAGLIVPRAVAAVLPDTIPFVPQRGLLHIGGVGAAGAGHVSVPADFGAGGGLCVMAHQRMGIRVGLAVAALARIAVGCFGAGGGGGWRVGLGRSLSRLSTAVVVHRWRVLGFGGLCIGGRGWANVVGRVFFTSLRLTVATVFGPLAGRRHPAVVVHILVGRTAVCARPLRGAGGIAAGVVGILRLIAAAVLAGTDMLILVIFRPRAPVVLRRIAVVALANIAISCRLTGRGYGFGVGSSDDLSGIFAYCTLYALYMSILGKIFICIGYDAGTLRMA